MKIVSLIHQKLYAIINHPIARRISIWILPYRAWIIIFVHIILFGLSYTISMIMLNNGALDAETIGILRRTILPLVIIRLVVFWHHDLYQGLWRSVSFQDLLNIIRAIIISSIIFVTIGAIWGPLRISQTLALLDATFCIMFVGGIRFIVRNIRETFLHTHPVQKAENILLVGPLNKVQPLVKEFIGDPDSHYQPYAIVDPTKQDRISRIRVSDVPVLSPRQILAQKARLHGFNAIVLCWPGATRKQIDSVVEDLKFLHIPFKTIPPTEDILSGRVSISDIRDVEIEDLLERPPVQIEMDQVRAYLHDKTVLVTGGGGSIGSELCRQIAGFKPKMLVLVERSENSLYELQLELTNSFPDLPLYASISTINDGPGLCALLEKTKVDVIFHAAAYKHVPLMEVAPVESSYNNILGTYNIAKASLEAGVKRFVMISTDKAVNPTNVMGVTKRIAEMVIQGHNTSTQTRFITVRFGNVLGSEGSVIPIFKKQILQGKPLTVTHPEMERFFMTIPESVQLVLQAGCMGQGGEIFVLDMGKPVKILKLAEKLITLSGKHPYEDIDIKFTEPRPGEKMYEELFNTGERRIETAHPRIAAAISEHVTKVFMELQIKQIQQLVRRHDEEGLRAKFSQLVPDYQCHPAELDLQSSLSQQSRMINISDRITGLT